MIFQIYTHLFIRLGTSVLLALAGVYVRAATYTWDGNGGNSPQTTWSTGNNWNPNGAPVRTGGHDLIFATGDKLSNSADGGDWTINSLTFDNTAGAFILSGDILNIGAGGITNNSTAAQTLNNQITLSATQDWTASSGAITATGYINAAGNSLTLTGANTITVSGQLNNVAALNLTGSGNRTFNTTNQVAAATINVASTGTTTFNGQINVGTLNASAGTSTFANVQATAGINVSGTAGANFTGPVTGGTGGVNITSSGNIDFSGTINSGSLTLNGTGTTTLSGSGGKSTGAVVVNSGTLVLAQTGGGDALNNTLTVNSGGTVIFAGNNQVPEWQTVTLNTGSTLYLGDTSQTFAGLVINGDSVIDFGTGGSQLNVTYNNITIANGVTVTIQNWDADAGDVFGGANPGSNVVNVQYADSSGNIYATGTWGGGYVTPGTPVPEPSTYGLLLLGGSAVFVLCRRRRIQARHAGRAPLPAYHRPMPCARKPSSRSFARSTMLRPSKRNAGFCIPARIFA